MGWGIWIITKKRNSSVVRDNALPTLFIPAPSSVFYLSISFSLSFFFSLSLCLPVDHVLPFASNVCNRRQIFMLALVANEKGRDAETSQEGKGRGEWSGGRPTKWLLRSASSCLSLAQVELWWGFTGCPKRERERERESTMPPHPYAPFLYITHTHPLHCTHAGKEKRSKHRQSQPVHQLQTMEKQTFFMSPPPTLFSFLLPLFFFFFFCSSQERQTIRVLNEKKIKPIFLSDFWMSSWPILSKDRPVNPDHRCVFE